MFCVNVCTLFLVGLVLGLLESPGCVFVALGFVFAVGVYVGLLNFMVWERDPILSVFAL